MKFSGLDEAALGPRLGPFTAALTEFRVPDDGKTELYDLLSRAVSSEPKESKRLAVTDSKKIYKPPRGAPLLEEAVLAFLIAAGAPFPKTFADFLNSVLRPEDLKVMENTSWLGGTLPLPWSARPDVLFRKSEKLMQNLHLAGVHVVVPVMRLVPAAAFNSTLSVCGGKGEAVQDLLSPLLRRGAVGIGRLTVDRQGGRRYYGEWLKKTLGTDSLKVVAEERRLSIYEAGRFRVEFLVRADGLRLETALASMLAKYVRESSMVLFNRWWAKRVPGLRPTAGYPADARRFLTDLTESGALPENLDSLVRRI